MRRGEERNPSKPLQEKKKRGREKKNANYRIFGKGKVRTNYSGADNLKKHGW